MNYRYATLNDVMQVTQLYSDLCFHIKETSKDPYWDFEEFPMEAGSQIVAGFIENEESAVLVAEEGNELIGMMILEVIPCHLPLSSHQRIGYIAGGFIKEGYRGQGIMKKLEIMSNDFFRGINVKYVEVNYIPANTGSKEAWNAMGYENFREQARKCLD